MTYLSLSLCNATAPTAACIGPGISSMAGVIMVMLPYFPVGSTSSTWDTTNAALGSDGTALCFRMKSRRVCTVETVGEIGAMQRTAVFTIHGVKLLYANPFRSLTSCATLQYDKCVVLVARRWGADSAITRFKLGPKMIYFWAGRTIPYHGKL